MRSPALPNLDRRVPQGRRRWLRPLLVALAAMLLAGTVGCEREGDAAPASPASHTGHSDPDDEDDPDDDEARAQRVAAVPPGVRSALRGGASGALGRTLAHAELARRAERFTAPLAGVDLTPYLSGAPAEAARALFDAERYRDARAAYDALAAAPDAAPSAARAARFMAALAAFYADDWRDALARFEALHESYPELVDTHRTLGAIAAYQLRDYETAVALADRVDARAGNGVRAAQYAARALLRLRRPAEARERLVALDQRLGPEPTTLLLLAQAYEAEQQRELELAVYRRLDERFPESWEASVARRRLDARSSRDAAEPASTPVGSKQRAGLADLRAGQREYERYRTEPALRALERALARLDDGSPPWCEALYYLSRALERTRDYAAASARYDEAVARCAGSPRSAEILFYGARSHFRNATHGRALQLLGTLRAAAPVSPELLDEALLLEAHVHEARLDTPARRRVLEHILLERSDPVTLHEAAFQLAWQDYRAGNYLAVVATVDGALERLGREERSYSRGRLPYWRARALERLGETGAALAGYRALLTSSPMSWYAHLALARLAEHEGAEAAREAFAASLREAWPQPAIGQDFPAGLSASPAFVAAIELARMGLTVSVRRELEALVDEAHADELWLFAELLLSMGEVTEAVELARRQLSEFQDHPPGGAHRARWELAYPRPHAELVASSSSAAAIDEALALAIMREETSFNAGAESPANALGLMQLMLPTARGLVEAGEGLVVDAVSLRDPALNVRLGCRYLGRMSAQLAGHPALVAAAYNAGGPRVRAWLASAPPGQPLDEFVEEIPFVETRRYAKRVVSTMGVYTYLRDGVPLVIELGLPARDDGD